LPATELVRYRNGDSEVWAIFRNARPSRYATDGAVRVESSAFESQQRARLQLRSPAHLYDVRRREYLGHRDEFEFTLDPWRPTILTLSRRELPPPQVDLKKADSGSGQPVRLLITLPWAAPQVAERSEVVHVAVRDPAGRRIRHYESTLNFKGVSVSYTIPFASSDRRGDWTVSVYHPLSGRIENIAVRVD
jgi:hypothetical protein